VELTYLKGHGTENDFVLLPDLDGTLELTPSLVARLCDRRAGLGAGRRPARRADQREPEASAFADDAEWFMDYRNADGSIAEMCGNGVRVYARYLVEAGPLAPFGTLSLATRGGLKEVVVEPTPSRSTWASRSSASRCWWTASSPPTSTWATRTPCPRDAAAGAGPGPQGPQRRVRRGASARRDQHAVHERAWRDPQRCGTGLRGGRRTR
jgi:hypothetical protein